MSGQICGQKGFPILWKKRRKWVQSPSFFIRFMLMIILFNLLLFIDLNLYCSLWCSQEDCWDQKPDKRHQPEWHQPRRNVVISWPFMIEQVSYPSLLVCDKSAMIPLYWVICCQEEYYKYLDCCWCFDWKDSLLFLVVLRHGLDVSSHWLSQWMMGETQRRRIEQQESERRMWSLIPRREVSA